ncbi:MAG: transposase DNA-binding-containing protein [Candidatus Tectimicrobiota bacterium]
MTQMGLGTTVIPLAHHLGEPDAVRAVAACDVLFGCMDSVDGRHLLNRLATFYLQPYFDVGIKIEADGTGGVAQVCGTVPYLQPGKSSLLSRGTYTMEQVRAAGLRRSHPEAYAAELHAKYLVGVQEERPAVMSVNMQFASLAVNEFLARLHPYRDDDNARFATYRLSLSQAQLYTEAEGTPCHVLARHVGRGDTRLLLDMPELSERMHTHTRWAARVAAGTVLPDKRLAARLGCSLATFAERPSDTIPQAAGSWGQAKGLSRFLATQRVQPAALSQGLSQDTARRCWEPPVVLVVQDTTSLHRTGCHVWQELGPMDAGH